MRYFEKIREIVVIVSLLLLTIKAYIIIKPPF
jgi:hypothetical protein